MTGDGSGEAGGTAVHVEARRHGLGEVRRIYRERNPMWTLPTGVIVVVAAVATTAGAVPDSRWRWPVLFLGPMVAVGLVAAEMFLAPVRGVVHRRLIGVSDIGLLVYTEDGGSDAAPWNRIVTFTRLPGHGRHRCRLVIRTDAGKVRFTFRDVHDARSLAQAVTARRPTPAPVRRRVLVGTAATVALAVLGWLAVRPAFAVALADRLPADLAGFAVLCEEPGTAFRRAAPYAAAAPRPAAVVGDGAGPMDGGFLPWLPATPSDVQVVICVYRAGEGEEQPIGCTYGVLDEKREVPMKVGRYEVTVYEARTRRIVRERTIVGDSDVCPPAVDEGADTVHTTISAAQFQTSMAAIVGTG